VRENGEGVVFGLGEEKGGVLDGCLLVGFKELLAWFFFVSIHLVPEFSGVIPGE
jgi:hypothetical protein